MAALREVPECYRWANDLKVGDEVYETTYRSTLSKASVSKITKSHIYIGPNNTSYPRRSLLHRVDSWTSWKLIQKTPEMDAIYQREQALSKITSLAHEIYNTKTRHSALQLMTTDELHSVIIAMETVCTLLDDAAKGVKE